MQHPNIVQIFAIEEKGELPYFAMEYLAGGSLSRRMAGKPIPPREAAALVATLARAVHVAHEKGILHRDLKPSNVLLAPDGTPKVADFGLAKNMGGDPTETSSGQIIGTPSYMSPEQAAGRKVIGTTADVYGLGAILYECLTASPPFRAETPGETISDVLTKPPTPPRSIRREVDRVLEAVCLTCLEKRPEDRYQSAQALAEDLDSWLQDKPTRVRPPSFLRRCGRVLRRNPAVTSLALLLLMAVLILVLRPDPSPPDRRPDPDAEPRRMRHELQAGHRVTLIDALGGPRWTHTTLGETVALRPDDNTREFSLEAKNARVVQLLPSPGTSKLLLRAEISHEKADASGEAGIFFGLESFPLPDGKAHLLCVWTFNDRVSPAANGNRPTMTFIRYREQKLPDGLLRVTSSKLGGGSGKDAVFQPVGPVVGNRTWRSLAVEISPDSVTAYWNGKVSHTLDGPAIRTRLRGLLDGVPELSGREPVFRTDAPLGLFLQDGAAIFKNVVVEPR